MTARQRTYWTSESITISIWMYRMSPATATTRSPGWIQSLTRNLTALRPHSPHIPAPGVLPAQAGQVAAGAIHAGPPYSHVSEMAPRQGWAG